MRFITILLTNVIAFLLRIIHRGGSLPGSIALKLNPSLLNSLKIDCPLILVTGTNGKTSTCNMIAELFETANKKTITNRKGDNLKEGITTAIVTNTTLFGKVKADIIVLEVDELNIPYLMKQLPVSTLVVTNFFRDQLDRAREMEQLIQKIEAALGNYSGTLVLNGNDPNVVRLKETASKAKAYYFGMDRCVSSSDESDEASEGKFCPVCGNRLQYDFYQYSHIGVFHCTNCSFKTPDLFVHGEVVSIPDRTFKSAGKQFQAPQDGLYTMYNCMAVLCMAKLFQLDEAYAQIVFKNIKIPNGRNEHFTYNGHNCVLNLIKNPTGANEVIKVIEDDQSNKTVLIVLNDNIQDGTDISWIYDTHFEKLINNTTTHIICAGLRAYDMAVRMKYAGYDKPLEIQEQLKDAVESLQKADHTMYVIATYTALQPVRNLLRRDEA